MCVDGRPSLPAETARTGHTRTEALREEWLLVCFGLGRTIPPRHNISTDAVPCALARARWRGSFRAFAGFPVDLWVFSNEWHTGASQFSACAELQPMRTLCVVESTCRGYSLPVNSHCSFGAVHTLVAKDGLRHVR
jgi:hypothetical protein